MEISDGSGVYRSVREYIASLNKEDRASCGIQIEEAQTQEDNYREESTRQNNIIKDKLRESGNNSRESTNAFGETVRELEGALEDLNSVIEPIEDGYNARLLRKKGKPILRFV